MRQMFKILDGRKSFFQWDLNRKLLIEDASITEVHFCNSTDDCALVVEVFEENGARVCNVPNIILQDIWRVKVYAYDGEATKHSATFEVVARSKPADYVYTETETLNFNTLLARIKELEGKEHILKIDFPKVWELNSGMYHITTGFYFAEDLEGNTELRFCEDGYLTITKDRLHNNRRVYKVFASDGNIYTGISTPNTIMTSEGIKTFATGTIDWCNKTDVIDDNSTDNQYPTAKAVKGYVDNTIANDKEWKLITDITIPEENASVTLFVNKDDNGKPFSYTEIDIVWEGIKVTDGTKHGAAWISLNPIRAGYNVGKCGHSTNSYFYYIDNAYPNYTRGEWIRLDRGVLIQSGATWYMIDTKKVFPNGITSLEISGYGAKSFYGRVVIYGR